MTDSERHVFRLYVAGALPGSARAVETLVGVCEEYLPGRYDLEVVDVYQQPELALAARVESVPMLLRLAPSPVRRILGELSDRERLILELALKPDRHEENQRPSKTP